MLLRLATFGALGYAGYNYYIRNREQVDDALRRLTKASGETDSSEMDASPQLAGGPLSGEARLVHAGEGPVS